MSVDKTTARAIEILEIQFADAIRALQETNVSNALARVIERRAEEAGNEQTACELAYAAVCASGKRNKPDGLDLTTETHGFNKVREKMAAQTVRAMRRRIEDATT